MERVERHRKRLRIARTNDRYDAESTISIAAIDGYADFGLGPNRLSLARNEDCEVRTNPEGVLNRFLE